MSRMVSPGAKNSSGHEPHRSDIPDFNPRGCQKGACYTRLQLSDSRIIYPLKRAGERGEGKWKRVSWDEALTDIADRLIDAAVTSGTESIVFDDGTTNAGYGPDSAGDMRFAQSLETTRIDSWAGVSDMPMGTVQTWGMINCEGSSDDWFRSDYIVVWVGNPAYTRIPDVHFMHEARYRGARLVVVAPDYSATAVHADLWLNLKPETDAALGLACAQVMIEEDLFRRDYVLEQSDMPFLVRIDNQRFLRQADVERGGADNAFFLWDEATGALAIAPGCEGDGSQGRSLALGSIRPALSGRFDVQLSRRNQRRGRNRFRSAASAPEPELPPRAGRRHHRSASRCDTDFCARDGRRKTGDDFRFMGRLQTLPQRLVPARHDPADEPDRQPGVRGRRSTGRLVVGHGWPGCDRLAVCLDHDGKAAADSQGDSRSDATGLRKYLHRHERERAHRSADGVSVRPWRI